MTSCPYCTIVYPTEEEVVKHSLKAHPGKPVVSELNVRKQQQALSVSTIQGYAYEYYELGFSVIPLHANPVSERKRPAVKEWTSYMQNRADMALVHYWFENNTATNVGLVLGKVSGAIAIDIDGKKAAQRFENKLVEMGYGNLHATLLNTMKNKTGGGGYHIIVRPEPSCFDALDLRGGLMWRDSGESHSEIRLLGGGHYIVAAPSVHPNGQLYVWNKRAPAPITRHEIEQLRALLDERGKQVTLTSTTENVSYAPGTEKMTPAIMKSLLMAVVPHYKRGARNQIVLGVAGKLRKKGYTLEGIERFARLLCNATQDEEVDQRIQAVRATFAKPIDKIAGRALLDDFE